MPLSATRVLHRGHAGDHRVFQQAAADQGLELFAFESDFVASLRCIPMAVRFKLDLAGIKLSLRQWSRFTLEDRAELLARPCKTPIDIRRYRARLILLVSARAGEIAKDVAVPEDAPWAGGTDLPETVRDYASSKGLEPPTVGQWRGLTDLRRFTLIKLSRDNHDNVNFEPALREFGL